ncbi:MAG TPA: hypothetical protein VFA50_02695 [Stellaceae bacterium]|nr:hypothetical protein [Stellaceae bacterium]
MKSEGKAKSEEQARRFIETARQLGCDEDEAAFDEKLKRITKPKPPPDRDGNKPATKKPGR